VQHQWPPQLWKWNGIFLHVYRGKIGFVFSFYVCNIVIRSIKVCTMYKTLIVKEAQLTLDLTFYQHIPNLKNRSTFTNHVLKSSKMSKKFNFDLVELSRIHYKEFTNQQLN